MRYVKAQFTSSCPKCPEKINPGDEIAVPTRGASMHVRCAAREPAPVSLKPLNLLSHNDTLPEGEYIVETTFVDHNTSVKKAKTALKEARKRQALARKQEHSMEKRNRRESRDRKLARRALREVAKNGFDEGARIAAARELETGRYA